MRECVTGTVPGLLTLFRISDDLREIKAGVEATTLLTGLGTKKKESSARLPVQ